MITQKNLAPGRSQEFYQSLPKVELHRHLEGSLRLETMVEIASLYGMRVKEIDQLRTLVQVNDGEPYNFKNFLSKFETLRTFYQSPDIIGRFAQEVVADAAADNVRYLELRFTPMALSAAQGFPLAEVIDWVIENVEISSRRNKIQTRLIVSLNRHESVQVGEKIIALAVDRKDRPADAAWGGDGGQGAAVAREARGGLPKGLGVILEGGGMTRRGAPRSPVVLTEIGSPLCACLRWRRTITVSTACPP